MPRYKKKITDQMEFEDFQTEIDSYRHPLTDEPLPLDRKAFLNVLFFSAARVSEVIALTPNDIHCTKDFIFINFFRLKGSKQTDPVPLPRNDSMEYLCGLKDNPFSFSRTTGYRIVKHVFPKLYPHFFRANRITKISDKWGDATVYSFVGICAQSIDHYRSKVDIKKVGKALLDEIKPIFLANKE